MRPAAVVRTRCATKAAPVRPNARSTRPSRRAVRMQATPQPDTPFNLPPAVVAAARAPWFTIGVQGAVALIVAAAVDAAYSGDWSRIGAITPDTEAALKPLVHALAVFHLACAIVAARAAASKGRNPVPAGLKAAAVGFLAAVEAVLAEYEK